MNNYTMRHFAAFLVTALIPSFFPAVFAADATNLRCEYRTDPLGIDAANPRLSWTIESDKRGERQTAYQILAASTSELLSQEQGDLWDSGRVESDQTAHVVYAGKPLASRMQCFWKVRAWDKDGNPSAWSKPASWTMSLLRPEDWQGKWIGGPFTSGKPSLENASWIWTRERTTGLAAPGGTRYFRLKFDLPADARIQEAKALVAADNRFSLRVNGKSAGSGDSWSKIDVIDVAKLLRPGKNVAAISATNDGNAPNDAGLIGAILVTLSDGKKLEIKLDHKTTYAIAQQPGWDGVDFDDSAWRQVRVLGAIGIGSWGKPAVAVSSILPIFRREFQIDKPVRKATVYVCGLGHYELFLNGGKVGDHVYDPGWTEYTKTNLYSTYDVTAKLRDGGNAFGVILGNGFYNQEGGRNFLPPKSFGPPKVILQLHLEYADGTSADVVTDESWKAAISPITYSDVYGGEDFDARIEQAGWTKPGFNDSSWRSAKVVASNGSRMVSQSAPPVKIMETFRPVKITEPSPGVFVYDFGQNCSGRPRITVKGPAGSQVKLTPEEVLCDDGKLRQKYGPCSFTYTLKGNGEENWAPRFSSYGFRYVQVEGASRTPVAGKPRILSVESEHARGSAAAAGRFACSNDMFNRIHGIIDWAIRSNMWSVLTDCPHRERMGWLEEDHLMGPSIMYNYDIPPLFEKICNDMSESQTPEGLVPDVSPTYPMHADGFRDAPAWGSSSVIVPWFMYQWYGDKSVLEKHYGMMKRYVDYLTSKSHNGIVSHGLGDWCDMSGNGAGFSSQTPLPAVESAIYTYDVAIMEQVARLLGKTQDAKHYSELAATVRNAYNREFFHPKTNQYATGTQASNAMPLGLGIVEPGNKAAVLENIVKDIRAHRNHLTVGEVSHRFFIKSLAEGGRSDVVFDMTNQTDVPSYGCQLAKGMTSLAETWDVKFGNSMNHFMLGHIDEWFYRDLAGIQCDPNGPGYKKIIIKPQIVGDLTWVKCFHDSIHGRIASDWRREGDKLSMNIAIPANTTATIHVPTKDATLVAESGKPATSADGVKFLRMENNTAVYAVGSGSYRFQSTLAETIR